MDFINFCHPCLNPSVVSSAVSAEGYEVTNLISSDIVKRNKGFMVYRTINPPIDLTFTFMSKVNISYIIIWPQVGSQKSCGFQIFTSGNAKPSSSASSRDFVNVGSGFLQDEPGIVFHHAQEPSPSNVSTFVHKRLSSKQNAIAAVRSVQIKVTKTIQSSVPAILKVEIWGLPSASCPKDVKLKVLDLWKQKEKGPAVEIKAVKEEKAEESMLRTTAKALVGSDFIIPEDFLDPITFEIMVLPFTLPSGKIVDQSTLEKHQNAEANWGRRPSDPFTGKLFTEVSKPVPATALKARIDRFLIEHADKEELKKIPRTTGRKADTKDSKGPEESENKNKYFDRSANSSDSEYSNVSNSSDKVLSSSNEKRKAKIELHHLNDKKPKIEEASCSKDFIKAQVSETCVVVAEAGPKRSHEDLLNDSINSALKSALAGLPSFTNFSKSHFEPGSKCCDCSETETLYQIPCKHFLCRLCLTQKIKDKTCICPECGSTFNSSDPKRYHL